MADHTPGPWEVSGLHPSAVDGGPVIQFANGSGRAQVAMVCGPRESDDAIGEQLANARLIAAAPDLLAALKAALDASGCDGDLCMRQWHEDARSAIAKAEGGSK